MQNFPDFIGNPYSIPPLISSFYFLGLGIFILSKNWRKEVNISFFIVSCACAIWLFSYAICFTRDNPQDAVFWSRNAYFGINFIAIAFYHWVVSILNLKNHRKFVFLGYAVMIIFTPVTRTNIFIGGVQKYFWGYYPYVGSWVYAAFLSVFVAMVTSVVVLAYLTYRRLKRTGADFLTLQKTKYVFISYTIMSCAMVDFIAKWKIPVYPFGYIFVWGYLTLLAYTIVRYRLFEIDTVIHRTLLWLITSSAIMLPMGVLLYFTRSWLSTLNWLQLTFLMTGLFYVYLFYYRKMQPKIDHFFRRRKYDYYQVLSEIGQKIGSELDISSVISRLFTELKDILYVRNGLVLVQQPGEENYTEAGSIGYDVMLDVHKAERVTLSHEGGIGRWFQEHRRALEREQVEVDPQYNPIKEEALNFLRQNAVELLIPVVMENKVNGIVGIGKKENLQAYTIKDIELLENMGRQIGITIDNALHHEDIVEKERLAEEMKLGREIQMALLPNETPRISGLTVEGLMNPAKEIGGDYYDFITLPNKDNFAVVIGDVSGKGVAAGLLMAMAKTAIHTLSQEEASPRKILLRTNTILNRHIGGQKFMTLLYFLWQSDSKTLLYSSGGHEHILLCRNGSKRVETIQSGGFMLGMLADIDSFLEEKQIKLEFGDKVLLYTDGVTEAQNQAEDRFGLLRLQEAFQKHSQKPANELMLAVKDEVYSFSGAYPQFDDITLVVLEAV